MRSFFAGVGHAFEYNRENFKYDRKQRQKLEYEIADMKIIQAGLWRQDVKDIVELTEQKMTVYLTVNALLLGFAVMAACKARCPPGAPQWLATSHILALMGAILYLFLAIWFGMHAFVAAQAYKVRILTQLVRLPVPTWQQLEASRTYASSFEKMKPSQMLRVPFVTGKQEDQTGGMRGSEAAGPSGAGAADPWGLERRGNDIAELAADVNDNTAQQRHIWLVREAALFYQTYDAFCRVAMSAGTSSLAIFFSYYCLSYVLTENAAPVASFMGVLVFLGIAIGILWMDMTIKRWEFIFGACMLATGPVLSAITTFEASKNGGHPGNYELLMPLAVFSHGLWFCFYLRLFKVTEMEGGVVLPQGFRATLYVDVFGWAKYGTNWWKSWSRRMRSRAMGRAPEDVPSVQTPAPPMPAVTVSAPMRPEDMGARGAAPQATSVSQQQAFTQQDSEEEALAKANAFGERPGLAPWNAFFVGTMVLIALWSVNAFATLDRALHGSGVFTVQPMYGGLQDFAKPPMASKESFRTLQGEQLHTDWPTVMSRPQGLSCNPEGLVFATYGRSSDGTPGLLHGHLVHTHSDGAQGKQKVKFAAAPMCKELSEENPIQDMAIHGCAGEHGCSALVLQEKGDRLVSCPLRKVPEHMSMAVDAAMKQHSLPLGRKWLEDGAGVSLDGTASFAEEPVSLAAGSCGTGGGTGLGSLSSQKNMADCVVLGTTNHRVVQMMVGKQSGVGSTWVPKRTVAEEHAELPGAGSLTLLHGRYLGALQADDSVLQVMDLHQGGTTAGKWRLPSAPGGGKWTSMCSGGDAFYVMDDADDPQIWRFPAPDELIETDGRKAALLAQMAHRGFAY